MAETIQRNLVEIVLEVLVIIVVAVISSSTSSCKESGFQALG
jgi:hypothetical protein